MPVDALALALGAAALHAFWNLLLAREADTEAATAVAVASLVVVLIVPAAATWRVEGAAVPFIAGSAALELAYVGLLAAAYRRFELSVVYPVARGLAPVLALVLTVLVTFSGPSLGEVGGVLAVAAGVLLVRGRLRGSFGGLGVGAVAASAGAYLLVLLALRLASAPSVAAVRETSVVIATALAAVVLKERVSGARLAGAVLVAAGVALLALS